jgi:hypothetical protein
MWWEEHDGRRMEPTPEQLEKKRLTPEMIEKLTEFQRRYKVRITWFGKILDFFHIRGTRIPLHWRRRLELR